MNWIIIGISLLITAVLHELSHLGASKLVGCKVEKFSIGFGPVLFKHTFRDTQYQIALIQLGGFCKLKGETEVSEDVDAYCNLRYRDKLKIIFAGVTTNIVTGLVCLFIATKLSLIELYLFGSVSLVLGVINAIPFPCLDGSYPFLVLLEKIFDRPRAYLYISRIVKVGFWILMLVNLIFLPYLVKMIIKN